MKGLVNISKYAGMREDIVQAGGGNSSVKIDSEMMAIKSSGIQLADISEDRGFSIVNYKRLLILLNDCSIDNSNEGDLAGSILEQCLLSGGRPSIETFLHSSLKKYTLHTHPVAVNAVLCRKNGESILRELFPKAYFVPYASPGVDLAREYYKTIVDTENDYEIVFLKNHGLVVSADDSDDVIRITEDVVNRIYDFLNISSTCFSEVTRIWRYFEDKIVWRVKDKDVVDFYSSKKEWNFSYCPDCTVFLGKKILHFYENITMSYIEQFKRDNGEVSIVESNGLLYILADSVRKARDIESILSMAAQIASINEGISCDYLPDIENNKLLARPDEKIRRGV